MPQRVREKADFLREVETRAKSRAEMARVLHVAPARITEMYKGERDLSYDEAVTLARHYGIEDELAVNAERLKPILEVCLRYAPKGDWTERDVQRLAEEIEYGLELLQSFAPEPPSQDALEVAGRAIAQRLRDKPA